MKGQKTSSSFIPSFR